MPLDVLIVGQGLAGSLLAWRLLTRGLTVVVVDNGEVNASRVAAGLINPVTGQRLVKSHRVDEFLPEALAFYRQLESEFGELFLVAKPMWRLLGNARLRALAEQRYQDAAYQDYLAGIIEANPEARADAGILLQLQTGYLRTTLLLERLQAYLLNRQAYRQDKFRYQQLQLVPNLQWHALQPTHIIFCEGYRMRDNPWFGHLPLQPAKGEILHCQTQGSCPEAIVNYGHWMIPLAAGRFKTGASFVGDLVQQNSRQTENHLLDELARHCPGMTDVQVIERVVGVRPTTLDKQPFIGTHPRYHNLHIFNGFGTKGSLAIPGYSRQFVAALLDGAPLTEDCDIKRYYATHFPD